VEHDDGDIADPRNWFARQEAAIVGLLAGRTAPATAYLQFVERHRGRELALAARETLVKHVAHRRELLKSQATRETAAWAAARKRK